MELVRLSRILRNRWKVLLLGALVGFAGGFGFSSVVNQDVESLYQAQIAVRFDPVEGESIEDLESEVEDQRGLAVLVAEDLLDANPNSSIYADASTARLFFVAEGNSPERAEAQAQQMVDVYLAADPALGGDVDDQLAAYEQQAADLQAEIEAMKPALSDEQATLSARHELIDLQIAAVRDRIVSLTIADAGAPPEEKAANAARLEDLRDSLTELQAAKDDLAPAPVLDLTVAERLRLDALERRMEILRLDYERLALRTMGVTPEGTVEPARIDDLTPEPRSSLTNGIVGFLGGGFLALFALFVLSRTRKEVWLAEDLPLPFLGSVPRRRVSAIPGPPWYDNTEGGVRKESIQAVRTSVEGVLDNAPAALALIGDHVDSQNLQALSVDLAASFASAGRTVLLLDANYSEAADITEYNVGIPTLQDVLELPATQPKTLQERLSSILKDAVHIRTDLAVIPTGTAPVSPADAVAGRQFRAFMKEAMKTFDLVMVVAGSAGSATAQVVVQRVGAALLAFTPGKATVPGVASLVADLDHQRIGTIGAVMIHGSEAGASLSDIPGLRWLSSLRRTLAHYREKVASPVSRLVDYPFPGSRDVSPLQRASLRQLARELNVIAAQPDAHAAGSDSPPGDGQLGARVLERLRSSEGEMLREPVANYLVSRVEDMMTAVAGQADLSYELVNVILESAFIPLTPTRGHRRVGDWLVEELRWEFGEEQGEALAEEFARILGVFEEDCAAALNRWVSNQFFKRHLERTQNEPEVWHLSSEKGSAQVLIHGRRLDKASLDRLIIDVVRRRIDELQRSLSEANETGDIEEIESLRVKLRELHQFEVRLGTLQAGEIEEARIRYPWKRPFSQPRGWAPVWAEGILPNIAPVQRLGLLASPVLSEDELHALEPTG